MNIAMKYPLNDDPIYCFLYCKFGVTHDIINGEKCLIVQYEDKKSLLKIKEIAKKFGLILFSTNKNFKNFYTIEKHTPRYNLGMLCEKTYNKYFK